MKAQTSFTTLRAYKRDVFLHVTIPHSYTLQFQHLNGIVDHIVAAIVANLAPIAELMELPSSNDRLVG
ncbi:hypothetical protein CCR75_005797 [Bremia lactucae]|uniref:Uncharacterized protein n=1 Tax=Bremia lactucae TaxID=4779 RepID=A0A976ICE1_BRELC|nr:hypothetical protein CCR75_005797 [Bremia lactucae]